MSEYTDRFRKPKNAGKLAECEFITEMAKSCFKPPIQTDTSCEGYRNPYTNGASLVCGACPWFSDNGGDSK